MNKITYRIDDIGSSTKYFNQHGKKWLRWRGKRVFYFPFANWSFLKRIYPFKGWAKYDELTAKEWSSFLKIFEENKIVPIIAITASWVEADSTLTPFPKKFPEEAQILKEAFLNGKIIIASHGLTHCVVGKHLPKFWNSNREYHREFLPGLDQSVHTEHLIKSQKILEDYFQKSIETLIPPGCVWSYKTYLGLKMTNIKKIMCNSYMLDSDKEMDGIIFIPDDQNTVAFHDRELKLQGVSWLKNLIVSRKSNE
jgi:hypothetical protein